MSDKLVNLDGLSYFWLWIKGQISDKFVPKTEGKGLSTNDFTDTLKQNYDSAHTHSQSAHAPSTAQANIIEIIKVNGVEMDVVNKTVNITITNPGAGMDCKIVSELPTDDIFTNLIYLILKPNSSPNNIYDEYLYIGGAWEMIGSTEVDMSGYVKESDLQYVTNSEIDAICVW